jgi:hypothetical protein
MLLVDQSGGKSGTTEQKSTFLLPLTNMPWFFLPKRLHSRSCGILSDTHLPCAVTGDETHSVPVIVVNVTLLKRALDLLLGVGRHHVETIDQLKVVLSGLPPVVKDIWRDAAPVANVSKACSQ